MDNRSIIWSKGPLRNQYSDSDTEKISSEETLVQHIQNSLGLLWIRNGSHNGDIETDLDIVSRHLDKIQGSVVLVTSDGDRPVPSSYSYDTINRILESNKILAWFTQNYDRTLCHEKLRPIPIGFNLHTKKWLIRDSIDEKIKYMIQCRTHSEQKIKHRILSDTHLSITHAERIFLHRALMNNESIDFLGQSQSFETITRLFNSYQFVLSPRGKGLDCHRTWELFLAGCIVITKTSPLDQLFRENHLPVVILQDWDELNHDLEQKLKDWYNQYVPMTAIENIYPKLSFEYWLPNGFG